MVSGPSPDAKEAVAITKVDCSGKRLMHSGKNL
jgi:hypothetical protein